MPPLISRMKEAGLISDSIINLIMSKLLIYDDWRNRPLNEKLFGAVMQPSNM